MENSKISLDPEKTRQLIVDILTLRQHLRVFQEEACRQVGRIRVSTDGEVDGFWGATGLKNMLSSMQGAVDYYPAFKQRANEMLDYLEQLEKETQD